MNAARPTLETIRRPSSDETLRLDLFFNLITSLSGTKNFDALGIVLSTQLRFLLDFEGCFLVLGDARVSPIGPMYFSTSESPCAARIEAGASLHPELARAL